MKKFREKLIRDLASAMVQSDPDTPYDEVTDNVVTLADSIIKQMGEDSSVFCWALNEDGDMPKKYFEKVEVLFRDGTRHIDKVNEFNWDIDDVSGDIMAFRYV